MKDGVMLLGQVPNIVEVIVIDSNQLLGMPPGSPSWTLLRVVAERTGHSLAVSEISLWEVLSNARRRLTEDVAAFNRAREKLVGRLESYASPRANWSYGLNNVAPEDAEIDEVINRYENQLRQGFRILQTPESVGVEALRREAWRRPPCNENGRGGRDTAIWLSAVAAAGDDVDLRGEPMPLLFVSNDNGFADPADKGRLHSTLADDLPSAVSARLCRNISDVFTEIGQPSRIGALLPMVNSAEVMQALVTTILDEVFPGMPEVREAGFVDENRRLVTIGELLQADRAKFEAFHGTPATCTAVGQNWLCATGTWIFPIPDDPSDLAHYAFGEMAAGSSRGLEITATLVLAFTADNSITQVQVVDFRADAVLRPAILVTRHEHHVSTMSVTPDPTGEWKEVDLRKIAPW